MVNVMLPCSYSNHVCINSEKHHLGRINPWIKESVKLLTLNGVLGIIKITWITHYLASYQTILRLFSLGEQKLKSFSVYHLDNWRREIIMNFFEAVSSTYSKYF